MEPSEALSSAAQIAVALAGFAGVVGFPQRLREPLVDDRQTPDIAAVEFAQRNHEHQQFATREPSP
jgi:hypothetical protein